MKFRAVPGTDLVVSEIGFGLETLKRGDADLIAAERTLRLAQDSGVTFFSLGLPHDRFDGLFARAFPAERRASLVTAARERWTGADLIERVAGRLEASGLDRFDVLLLESVESKDLEDGRLADAVHRLCAGGTVRHAGISAPPASPALADLRELERAGFTFLETELDLANREAAIRLESQFQRMGEERKITVIARSGVAGDPSLAFLWNVDGRTPLQANACFGLSFSWISTVFVNASSDTELREAAQAPLAQPFSAAELAAVRDLEARRLALA